jgi:hypothetical protein
VARMPCEWREDAAELLDIYGLTFWCELRPCWFSSLLRPLSNSGPRLHLFERDLRLEVNAAFSLQLSSTIRFRIAISSEWSLG